MGSVQVAVSGTEQETSLTHDIEGAVPGPGSSRTSSVIPDWSKRIPALDGLRGIAILLVLMYHSVCRGRARLPWPIHTAGRLTWTGVDLFFVLSGFLIGGILLDAKASPRYFKTFYLRRVYRIFPLYYLVTASILLLYARSHLQPAEWHGPIPWLRYLTFTQNAVYPGISDLSMTWSLCIEEQFYLVIPLLIRFLTRRQLVFTLVSVVVAVPFLRLLFYYHLPYGQLYCANGTVARVDTLCLGVLAAVLVRDPASWHWLLTKRIWLRIAFIGLLLGLIYLTLRGYSPATMATFGLSWIALFYAVVLIGVVSSRRNILQTLLSNRKLIALGALSYCIYIIHNPLQHAWRKVLLLAFRISPESTGPLPADLLGIGTAVMVAALSWKFFEKPLLRMGHKYQY
jgi:peptidoglycan/LPS O-acetylase OafA/YrhL